MESWLSGGLTYVITHRLLPQLSAGYQVPQRRPSAQIATVTFNPAAGRTAGTGKFAACYEAQHCSSESCGHSCDSLFGGRLCRAWSLSRTVPWLVNDIGGGENL